MNISAEQFFQALSDRTRLRVVSLLSREGELCVCELSYALDASQPKISRHLALLRDTGVVLTQRRGQWIYYRLNRKLPVWMLDTLERTRAGIQRQKPFAADRRRLEQMPSRPDQSCCA